MLQALEQSCDVFFYNVGRKLYDEPHAPMQAGLREFGFGAKTGIDLPYETDGSRVPDKDWKRETGKTAEDKLWKPGDEINLAIGQGDLLVTPLQLAVACSAIANAAEPNEKDTGGTVWVPHLGLKITDSAGGVIHEFSKELSTEPRDRRRRAEDRPSGHEDGRRRFDRHCQRRLLRLPDLRRRQDRHGREEARR